MSLSSFPTPTLRHIALPFALGAIAVIFMILKIGITSATITITPAFQNVKATTDLSTTPATTTADAISARLYSAQAETTEPVTGDSVRMEKGRAQGSVTIINNSSASQVLIASTRLLSQGAVLFRLNERAQVPARGSITASVTADQEGLSGNIPPTTFTIPGLRTDRQKLIYAESKKPMKGGLKEISLVTQKDINAARQKARSTLEQQLRQELPRQVSLPYSLPPSAVAFTERSFTTTAKADTAAENASVTLMLEAVGVALRQEDLTSALLQKIQTSRDPGAQPVRESTGLRIDEVTILSYNLDRATSTLSVDYSYKALPDIAGNKKIFTPIYGMKKKDAEDYLKNTFKLNSVDITLSPFWVKKIPNNQSRIHLIVEIPSA